MGQNLLLILIVSGLTACTSLPERLDRARVGMSKSKLLDAIGSPTRNQRMNGSDVWTYIYYEEDKRRARVITLKHREVVSIIDNDDKPKTSEAIEDADSLKEYETLVKKHRKEKESGFQDVPEPKDN